MSSIALNLLSRPASVPAEEPDTLPTQSAAEAIGPATATPRETGPTPAGEGSIPRATSQSVPRLPRSLVDVVFHRWNPFWG
jgi:hypothetical protein